MRRAAAQVDTANAGIAIQDRDVLRLETDLNEGGGAKAAVEQLKHPASED
ncbi:hypothetical protein [Kaistia terrae]|uniref:Uncharacterized protein n=1 Tax=Kaistia terrae TaxID=537017 RepID=A0ABW0Q4N0_9HYPH|nr:hypothetical protein [Kaistia terrae]MCX5581716.1 hypothetical protein [Kaistia terrae]